MNAIDPNARHAIRIGTLVGSLFLEPDGVYRIDGRVIPVGNDTTLRVDDGKLVLGVHDGADDGVGLSGRAIGVNVPE